MCFKMWTIQVFYHLTDAEPSIYVSCSRVMSGAVNWDTRIVLVCENNAIAYANKIVSAWNCKYNWLILMHRVGILLRSRKTWESRMKTHNLETNYERINLGLPLAKRTAFIINN